MSLPDTHTNEDDESAPDGGTDETVSRRTFTRAAAAATGIAFGVGRADAVAGRRTGLRSAVSEKDCSNMGTVDVGDGTFRAINNQWGTTTPEQCVKTYDDGSYGWEWNRDGTVSGDPNFPQVLVGTKPWGSDTGSSLFPVQRGEIDTFEIALDIDRTQSGGRWNLAEEWWLTDVKPEGNVSGSITHEILLVLDWSNEYVHGDPIEPGAITDRYGNTIDYWKRYRNDWDFRIFRIAGREVPENVDLSAIVDYVSENVDSATEDLWLSGVEVGNEYWDNTSGDVRINQFDTTLNGEAATSGLDGDGQPPTAVIDAPDTATAGEAVTFDAGRSTDPGGGAILAYSWTIEGQPASGVETIRTFDSTGSKSVTLTVTDDEGDTDTASTTVTVEEPASDGLLVTEYQSYPGGNALGNWAGAGDFQNGDGDVVGGALELVYDDAGWYVERILRDITDYSSLVFRIEGASGGEGTDFAVKIGGTEHLLAELADSSVSTDFSEVRFDLEAAGADRENPDQLECNFWQGESGTVRIDSIRLE